MKVVVGISGASGAIYGIRVLEAFKKLNIETHLIVSEWSQKTIAIETNYTMDELKELATYYYSSNNMAALISSGSFITDGMIIAPCSMKTLAAISHGYSDNLIARAADVTLKERRKLILIPREAPLNQIHLENMLKLNKMGATILPPMPQFYNKPKTIDDIINHTVSRALDQFEINNNITKRWLESK